MRAPLEAQLSELQIRSEALPDHFLAAHQLMALWFSVYAAFGLVVGPILHVVHILPESDAGPWEYGSAAFGAASAIAIAMKRAVSVIRKRQLIGSMDTLKMRIAMLTRPQ